jgi:hypothetical protein
LFGTAECNVYGKTEVIQVMRLVLLWKPINLKKSVEFTSAKNIQHKLDNPIGAIGTI